MIEIAVIFQVGTTRMFEPTLHKRVLRSGLFSMLIFAESRLWQLLLMTGFSSLEVRRVRFAYGVSVPSNKPRFKS